MKALVLIVALSSFGRAAPAAPVALSTPTFADWLADSGLKMAAGDFAKAKESAARAVALAAANPKGYLQRASCELKLKDYAGAEADATKAIDLKYEKASPFNVRSAARARQGRFAEALTDADAALKYSPGSAIAHMNRAAAETGLKAAPADILADYRRAAELDARFKPVYDAAASAAGVAAQPAPVKPLAAPAPKASASSAVSIAAPPRASFWPRLPAIGWRRPAFAAAGVILLLLLILGGRRGHRLRQVRFGGLPVVPAASERLSAGAVLGGRCIVGDFIASRDGVEFYEARDLSDAPRVIKRVTLGTSAQAVPALSKGAAAFKHAQAETVESLIQERGHLCLVCLPPPGETLDKLCRRLPGRKLSAEAALKMLQGACEALGAAHQAGLVHGRLRPSSLWVERGAGRLADFGLPATDKEPSVEADLYALGACLYEALTATAPVPEEGRVAAPSSKGASPAALDSFMARALAADPRSRFHSAAELLAAFKDAVVPPVQ